MKIKKELAKSAISNELYDVSKFSMSYMMNMIQRERREGCTSGNFLWKMTSNLASRVFSHTIFPSLEANTTPPALHK